jgi:hypothetical protein
MHADAVRAALRCDRPGCPCYRPRGQVHCPAHNDAHPSLSVDVAEDGRVLVHCHAGCSQEDVVEALRARGLWTGRPPAPALSRLRRGRLEGPLNSVARFVEDYVVLPSQEAVVAVSLWVCHAHAIHAFDSSPFLIIRSPTMRSGKTRLLECIELLVPCPWRAVDVSESVLFRRITRDHPTLLLDEVDVVFASRGERHEGLRALLNGGCRRGARVSRSVPKGNGFELVDFEVFAAKALAGIGTLPGTVEDRGIVIPMRRATPAEQRRIRRLRFREADAEAAPIRETLARWAEAALPKLREARPAIPDVLDGRAADSWEPLLAVAEDAGDGWAVAAWQAALALSTGAAREDNSVRVRLLADCRRAFDERGTDRLATGDLITALCDDETSPWGDWRGRRLTPEALARLLKPFGVRPERWRDGSQLARGYAREAFQDAWGRYVPVPSSLPATFNLEHPEQSSQDAGFGDFENPEQPPLVPGPENGANPVRTRVVPGVPGSNPLGGKETAGEAPEDLMATPEDLAKGGGAGQLVLRVGQSLHWPAYRYRPGHSIAAGKAAWFAFVRTNSDAEVRRAAEAMLADPVLQGPAPVFDNE